MTTMFVWKRLAAMAATVAAVITGLGAICPSTAWAGEGQPSPWQLNFQVAATPVMENIEAFHMALVYVITAITAFVLVLLLIIIFRFNSRANPTPSRTTHNTLLEVAWTIIPVAILVGIAIPSFKLLFFQLNTPPADLTVKATGKQWYWTYSYPDNGRFEFDSLLVRDTTKLRPDQPRLLGVDNELVVPVNKTIRVLTTGAEVIHAFAVPAFGIKIDSVPGRINETWFKATREGVYYGQCSELCGKDHAFMPIAVRVVSEQAFNAWVEEAKKNFARDDSSPTSVAVAEQSTVR
jgi:cytochrome c oxidase subunit 2